MHIKKTEAATVLYFSSILKSLLYWKLLNLFPLIMICEHFTYHLHRYFFIIPEETELPICYGRAVVFWAAIIFFIFFYIQDTLLGNCQEAARARGSVLSWNGALRLWAGGAGGVPGEVRGAWGPDINHFKGFSPLGCSILSSTRMHMKLALCIWVIFHPKGHCKGHWSLPGKIKIHEAKAFC